MEIDSRFQSVVSSDKDDRSCSMHPLTLEKPLMQLGAGRDSALSVSRLLHSDEASPFSPN